MTEEEMERLAQKFAEKLQQARSVSDSVHWDHHTWITERIAETKARAELWRELTKHVAKWGSVGVLSFVLYGLWLAFQKALKTL